MASHSQELSDPKVYGPRANTLVVYNFSPTGTILALVQTITLAGPFGTLYSAQLLSKSPINYPEFNGPCLFLTFTTRKASAHLLAFIRQHGIVHRRAVLQARWATITATKVPETDVIEDEPSPVCSRVLILKGDGPFEDWGLPLFAMWMRHYAINAGDVLTGLTRTTIDGEEAQVFVLNSHATAKLFAEYITTRPGQPSAASDIPARIEVSYGRDPLEFGFKHNLAFDTSLRETEIEIDYANFQWELPKKEHNSSVGAFELL